MTRFFYTDPLAAAWMAKHFGMKLEFLERYGDDSWMQPISLDNILGTMVNYGMDEYSLKKVFIHPDSLHLLKPQPGDLACFTWLDGSASCREFEADDFLPHATLDRDVRVPLAIIQRNGIPFQWPESEAA